MKSSKSSGLFSKSLLFSGAVLVVSFGVYFGVVYYRQSLQSSIASLNEQDTAKRNLIAGEKANRVADFADRLTVIDDNLKSTMLAPNEPFFRIEKAMIPEVNLTSYEYSLENGAIDTTIAADSFRAIAQQIIAFKKNALFSAVMIDGDARVGSNGKIEAKLILTL